MLYTIKTLQQEQLQVECDGATVKDLKAAMPTREDWRSSDAIKLCCNGHALADGDSLSGVAEYLQGGSDRFIVAIVQSTKPATAKVVVEQPTPPPVEEVEPVEEPPPPPPPPAVDDAKLGQLVDMGFDRATAVSALAASAGDVSRAVDLLMGGGPIPPPSSSSSSSGSGGGESSSGGSGSSGARARALRGLADLGRAARANAFAKDLIASEAQMRMLGRMPEVQRLLARPQLEGIQERPEDMQRLMSRLLLSPELQKAMKADTVSDEMIEGLLKPEEEEGEGGGGGGGGGGGKERLVAMAEARRAERTALGMVELSGEEEEAVGRLMELGGFGRREVLAAFVACEKNESMAASLLFSQMP